MKKPVVDYRKFSFSKINTPEFSHLKLLLGWVVYFVLFFLTENLIPYDKCHVIHSSLDDVVPFLEIFVIPYVFWYVLIVISLVWFALYNVDNFKRLQTFIIITQALAMTVYIFYPNIQLLRPDIYPRDNFLTDIVALIQTFDTPTGVFPSLHVAYSVGIASSWLKEKNCSALWKTFVVISAIVISLSTAFIKQHSVLDIFGAIPVCVVAEFFVWGKWWKKKLKKQGN